MITRSDESAEGEATGDNGGVVVWAISLEHVCHNAPFRVGSYSGVLP